jgi:hypothetical protein
MISHLTASIGLAQADAVFSQGVENFRAGKFEDAKKAFLTLHNQFPEHEDILLNLGLIAFKEKRIGAAIGIWRKGLVKDSSNESLFRAVSFARTKLEKQDVPREFGAWERYREAVIGRISLPLVVGISGILLFSTGWLWLRWLGRRKRAFEEEAATPQAPIPALLTTLLFVSVIGIIASIFIDRSELRGTVLSAKVSVLSAPQLEATALFDLFEGLEVIIQETRTVDNKTWRRITFPGGLSGWVPSTSIFATSDPVDRAFGPITEKANP